MIRSAYEVTVHMDSNGNMVIVKNPTLSDIPSKSGYTPKIRDFDSTIDSATIDEATEFLKTFFSLSGSYLKGTDVLCQGKRARTCW